MTELDKDKVKQLYKNGTSFAELGRMFGVSRQRIHQIATGYKSFASHNFSFANIPINAALCDRCGKKSADIHHLDGNSRNNKVSNLRPLCFICHKQVHHGYRDKIAS